MINVRQRIVGSIIHPLNSPISSKIYEKENSDRYVSLRNFPYTYIVTRKHSSFTFIIITYYDKNTWKRSYPVQRRAVRGTKIC